MPQKDQQGEANEETARKIPASYPLSQITRRGRKGVTEGVDMKKRKEEERRVNRRDSEDHWEKA